MKTFHWCFFRIVSIAISFFILTGCVISLNAQVCGLFFSEYLEGSSSNKALEIFNPDTSSVDLGDYVIYRYNNGSVSPTDSLFPAGMLLPGEVFVIGNPSASAAIMAESDTLHSICFYNGDDALSLINKVSNDTLDIIGEIGVDPGSGWTVGAGATNNYTLVRSDTVGQGTTDWSLSVLQWEVYTIDMVDSLGAHSTSVIKTMPACELYISEYLEGSSSNKAIEIFNPDVNTVNLGNYVIYRFNNGSLTATDSLFLTGTLASNDVYVVGNPSSNAAIMAESDSLHSITFFNGDDALALVNKTTNDTLDIIGEIGVDPGSGWTVGAGATNNYTLVRSDTVGEGTTDWSLSVFQWEVYTIDMVDSLGAHYSSVDKNYTAPVCELFISEYLEGSSSNKALEIYNPDTSAINLSNYAIYRFNNGSLSATDTLFPEGTLLSGEVFVVGNPSSNVAIMAESDTLHSICFFNGDDALALVNKTTGDTLDIVGEIGVDPGSGWTVGAGATNNYTLVRSDTVGEGTTDWSLSVLQWEVYTIDMVDSLGSHYTSVDKNYTAPVCELFISEYLEGSSSNKALEIYNPDTSAINLSNYAIYRFNNGSLSATDTLYPEGTLLSGEVFVVGNPSSNAAIMAESDTLHSICFFNGDDALALVNKTTGDTLDIIGEIGVDPGSGWTVGAGATNNYTLVRKSVIAQGNKNWTLASTEWIVFSIDMNDSLGAHYIKVDCETNVWNGSVSNDWFTADNWYLKHIPLITEKVLIPSGFTVEIPSGTSAEAFTLEVETGSEFIVDGELDVVADP